MDDKSVTQEDQDASDSCPSCKGRGCVETGELSKGLGGVGYDTVSCTDCSGTGEIFADDHETFKSEHGIAVVVGGVKRVVFFDYEGDGIFVWAFPNDKVTNGEHLTEDERQSVYEQLCAWYDDWTAPRPEDDL